MNLLETREEIRAFIFEGDLSRAVLALKEILIRQNNNELFLNTLLLISYKLRSLEKSGLNGTKGWEEVLQEEVKLAANILEIVDSLVHRYQSAYSTPIIKRKTDSIETNNATQASSS